MSTGHCFWHTSLGTISVVSICVHARAMEDAITRIHERRYHLNMSGEVILFNIAFWSKIPKGRSERIQIRDGTRV